MFESENLCRNLILDSLFIFIFLSFIFGKIPLRFTLFNNLTVVKQTWLNYSNIQVHHMRDRMQLFLLFLCYSLGTYKSYLWLAFQCMVDIVLMLIHNSNPKQCKPFHMRFFFEPKWLLKGRYIYFSALRLCMLDKRIVIELR